MSGPIHFQRNSDAKGLPLGTRCTQRGRVLQSRAIHRCVGVRGEDIVSCSLHAPERCYGNHKPNIGWESLKSASCPQSLELAKPPTSNFRWVGLEPVTSGKHCATSIAAAHETALSELRLGGLAPGVRHGLVLTHWPTTLPTSSSAVDGLAGHNGPQKC